MTDTPMTRGLADDSPSLRVGTAGGRSAVATQRVFISSTTADLMPYRTTVRDTLERLGLFPVAHELWGARSAGDAGALSTAEVASADVFLGIIAWRYGNIVEGETRSFTHREFETAKLIGLPCFMFLADPITESDDTLFPLSARDPEHRAQLMAFRQELERTTVVDYFTTPEDLGRRVAVALSGYLLQAQRQQPQTSPSEQAGDAPPTAERQNGFRTAYERNQAQGKAPYERVTIQTRGEVRWLMSERRWSSEFPLPAGYERVNLQAANLGGADLRQVNLYEANLRDALITNADLSQANLYHADLRDAKLGHTALVRANLLEADLSQADLQQTDLRGATLTNATLVGAMLSKSNLAGANLAGAKLQSGTLFEANLTGASLSGARLDGVDLRSVHMDASTVLNWATLDSWSRLADVVWNNVPLARLNWQEVRVLGDENEARRSKGKQGQRKDGSARLREYQDAVLATRQVATALRNQGLNEYADHFAYRAQLLQRIVSRRQRHYLRYLGSLLLDLLAGYGFRPGRSILVYLSVILWFANFYVWASHGLFSMGLPPTHVQPLAWYEGLILSVSSFHGRGFQPFQNLNDPIAALAGMQAVLGLIIEVSFIATFTQRFFAR